MERWALPLEPIPVSGSAPKHLSTSVLDNHSPFEQFLNRFLIILFLKFLDLSAFQPSLIRHTNSLLDLNRAFLLAMLLIRRITNALILKRVMLCELSCPFS